jgi:hypothetical protein
MAESFVGTLKTELVQGRPFPTRFACELALVEYLGWFNHTRLHEALGDHPPAEFEALYAAPTETITETNHEQGNHLTESPPGPVRLSRPVTATIARRQKEGWTALPPLAGESKMQTERWARALRRARYQAPGVTRAGSAQGGAAAARGGGKRRIDASAPELESRVAGGGLGRFARYL